jgi:hypothetical protein
MFQSVISPKGNMNLLNLKSYTESTTAMIKESYQKALGR